MMKGYVSIADKIFFEEVVIQKSRFLAFACGVSDTAAANSFITEISKKHYDATHNCYAYLLTDGQKFADDGEPQGTAGLPILECIKTKNLMNVAVVVTRYFGGTKLGAGGLVRAYTQAAAAVLESAEKVTFVPCREVCFTVNYPQMNALNSMLHKYASKIYTEYNEDVSFRVTVESAKLKDFEAAVTECLQGKAVLTAGGEFLAKL